MSRCDLEVSLDRPERTYAVGEKVAGIVSVLVNQDCRCRGLTVALQWRTHGKGNTKEGVARTLTVFEGDWAAGEQHFHDFEFEIPNGPVTYRGNILNVDWYVVVNADIPWAFDPHTEVDLVVLAGADPRGIDHGPMFAAGMDAAAELAQNVVGSVVGGMFALMGVGSLVLLGGVFFSAAAAGGEEEALILCLAIPFVAIFPAIGVWLLFTQWKRRIAERRLGTVQIDVPEVLRPGDAVPVTVRFTPKAVFTLASVSGTLRCREIVVRGSGTNKKTYTHDVFGAEASLSGELPVSPGQEVVLQADFALPRDAAPSFAAPDNQLRWSVDVHVDIPRWPDFERESVLTVEPSPTAA